MFLSLIGFYQIYTKLYIVATFKKNNSFSLYNFHSFLNFSKLLILCKDIFLINVMLQHGTWVFGGTGLMFAMWLEIGRMLSWSSITTQFLQDARDKMNLQTHAYVNKVTYLLHRPQTFHKKSARNTNLSLNLPTTSWWASVLYRECTSWGGKKCLSSVQWNWCWNSSSWRLTMVMV